MSQRLRANTQGPSLMVAWQDIPWKQVQRHVFRLQKRMYRATQHGQVRTAHKLQKLLLKSWYARLLAVRRITQDNRGKHTAGIDGRKSLTPPQRWRLATALRVNGHAAPLRRTSIRNVGVPTSARSESPPKPTEHAKPSCAKPSNLPGKPSCLRIPMAFVR